MCIVHCAAKFSSWQFKRNILGMMIVLGKRCINLCPEKCIIFQWNGMEWGSGYLKALERGNNVLRPKRFCEADRVNLNAILSQNLKCFNLRNIYAICNLRNIT